MKRYLILITFACLFTSCRRSDNGLYVVSAFKAGDNGSSKLTDYLKKTLRGAQFEITFDTTMTVMKSITTLDEYTLRRQHSKIPAYLGQFQKQSSTLIVILKRDKQLTMEVSVTIPQPEQQSDTTQYSGSFNPNDVTKESSEYAEIECYLTKVHD